MAICSTHIVAVVSIVCGHCGMATEEKGEQLQLSTLLYMVTLPFLRCLPMQKASQDSGSRTCPAREISKKSLFRL